MNRPIERGQIYYANLDPVKGSEQGGSRPVVIIQNNTGNKHSPCVIVAIITSRREKARLPTHCWLGTDGTGLSVPSMVECEQIRTIDKTRLGKYLGKLTDYQKSCLDHCLKISLGIHF